MVDVVFDEDAEISDVVDILNIYHDGLFDESERGSLSDNIFGIHCIWH